MLNTGLNKTTSEIMANTDFTLYIDNYKYIAVESKKYTFSVDVNTQKCENGLEYSDGAYVTPINLYFKLYVLKDKTDEFDRLKNIYANRSIISITSLIYNCNNAVITSLNIVDEYFDCYVIDIDVAEILYGDSVIIEPTDSRFQILSGTEKYNVSYITGNDTIKSNETADTDNWTETVGNIKPSTLNKYTSVLMGNGVTTNNLIQLNNYRYGTISGIDSQNVKLAKSSLVQNAKHVDSISQKYSKLLI